MTTYDVPVRLERVFTGHIPIDANSPEEAEAIVRKMMANKRNPLQTVDARIEWGEPEYVDGSFDVDESQFTWRR